MCVRVPVCPCPCYNYFFVCMCVGMNESVRINQHLSSGGTAHAPPHGGIDYTDGRGMEEVPPPIPIKKRHL